MFRLRANVKFPYALVTGGMVPDWIVIESMVPDWMEGMIPDWIEGMVPDWIIIEGMVPDWIEWSAFNTAYGFESPLGHTKCMDLKQVLYS